MTYLLDLLMVIVLLAEFAVCLVVLAWYGRVRKRICRMVLLSEEGRSMFRRFLSSEKPRLLFWVRWHDPFIMVLHQESTPSGVISRLCTINLPIFFAIYTCLLYAFMRLEAWLSFGIFAGILAIIVPTEISIYRYWLRGKLLSFAELSLWRGISLNMLGLSLVQMLLYSLEMPMVSMLLVAVFIAYASLCIQAYRKLLRTAIRLCQRFLEMQQSIASRKPP